MRKVVINSDFGGFGLSDQATELLFKLKGWKLILQDSTYGITNYYRDSISDDNLFFERDLERDDPELIQVVETLKDKANGRYSSLKVVEIPDDVDWYIKEYDGLEHVAEKHRTWR